MEGILSHHYFLFRFLKAPIVSPLLLPPSDLPRKFPLFSLQFPLLLCSFQALPGRIMVGLCSVSCQSWACLYSGEPLKTCKGHTISPISSCPHYSLFSFFLQPPSLQHLGKAAFPAQGDPPLIPLRSLSPKRRDLHFLH